MSEINLTEPNMRLAVLDLTGAMPELLADVPRASAQIIDWLSPALPQTEFMVYDICGGQAFPMLDAFDGVVVSGSECGVYDAVPWMQPLRDFLNEVRRAQRPCFGICFGHQIMADTWGGVAEMSAQGNVIGARRFSQEGRSVNAFVWHKDQVTKLPPEAQVQGDAAHCPMGVLAYSFPALSVQFHPEFTADTLRLMFERLRGHHITDGEISSALASFSENPVDPALMRQETAAFFRKHIPAA